MALDTYANLKQSIIDHLDRDDLTAQVDDFIDIAEARHKRDVRIREMLTRATLAITDGDRYADLPTDFLDLSYFRLLNPDTTAARRYLPSFAQLNEHELTDKSTNRRQRPQHFSVHEQIEFDSEVEQDYTGEIIYYVELTPLSDGDPVNVLLTRAPDVYLYAALAASAPFLLNDERIGVWENLYVSAKDDLNRSRNRAKRSGPQIAKAPGVGG